MENKLLGTQILAVVLFLLLLVSFGFLLSMRNQLKEAQASQGFAVAHDRIRSDCHGPQGTRAPACMQDLKDLADTLKEFSNAIGTSDATTTPPVPAQ